MDPIVVADCTTGEVVEVPLTSEEQAQRQADADRARQDAGQAEAERQARIDAVRNATSMAELKAALADALEAG